MIRLLVNTPRRPVGSLVSVEELGDAFAQQLLEAGQAEEVADETPEDPADVVLCEIFELEDRIDAAISRRGRVQVLIAGLGEDVPDNVAAAFATASRVRPELFGLETFPAEGDAIADLVREAGFETVEILTDRARIGAALIAALPEGYAYSESPVEIVADLSNRVGALRGEIALLKAQIKPSDDGVSTASAGGSDGAGGANAAGSQAVAPAGTGGAGGAAPDPKAVTAPNDKPPTDAGSSGEAVEAPASTVEPPKAADPKPARKPASAAQAKARR